jgi:hypothetical protein
MEMVPTLASIYTGVLDGNPWFSQRNLAGKIKLICTLIIAGLAPCSYVVKIMAKLKKV